MMALHGLESVQHLSKLIDDTFPSMQCAICYGSRAFPQLNAKQQPPNENNKITAKNENSSFFESLSLAKIVSPYYLNKLNEPMIDFIFIVNDSKEWHSRNLSTMNYYHYSTFLRIFGSPFVCYIQSLGPGVLYNPFISINNYNMMIKYGVITTSQLMQDLLYWKSLYIAGRLHKPVLFLNKRDQNDIQCVSIKDNNTLDRFYKQIDTENIDEITHDLDPEKLNEAVLLNLDYAVRVALIILISENKNRFTLKELFTIIASLSYCGDNRHSFYSEDVNKFEKIVNGSYNEFVKLYDSFLMDYTQQIGGDNDGYYAIKYGVDIDLLCRRLPGNLRKEMINFDGDIMHHLHDKERVNKCIKYALCNIVSSSSWIQTIKGILSAGFINSIWYFARKINKYYKSVNNKKHENDNNNQKLDGLQSV